MKNTHTIIAALIALAAPLLPPLHAFETLESDFRTNGAHMHALVTTAQQVLQKSSAVIYTGRNELTYGTVISPDGHILTKASELTAASELNARVDRTAYPTVTILATDTQWDVALIKINATGLTPVPFAENSQLEPGTWLVANGVTNRTQRRPLIGIVSANPREIKAEGGAVLGVQIDDHKQGLLVQDVPEKTGAHKAGIKKGDIITTLADTKVKDRKAVARFMKERRVGEKLPVTILRDGAEKKLTIELSGRADTFGAEQSRNDSMSGLVSKRRSGFPRILQHDILGSRQTVGGPLLDLDGRCIGMNIARANRCESFAIPLEQLRPLADKLMEKASSGEK